VHCSGASTVQALEAASRQGAAMAGAILRNQIFAGREQAAANLPGSTFGIEAAEPLLSTSPRSSGAPSSKAEATKAYVATSRRSGSLRCAPLRNFPLDIVPVLCYTSPIDPRVSLRRGLPDGIRQAALVARTAGRAAEAWCSIRKRHNA
jgi:hypothetical protein